MILKGYRQRYMKFRGDIIITDPVYAVKSDSDWGECDYGDSLDRIGLRTFLSYGNGDRFGDRVIDRETGECIGRFCQDSGVLSVMLLSELRAYDGSLPERIPKHCYAVIRDFEGSVIVVEGENGEGKKNFSFVGKGRNGFRTELVTVKWEYLKSLFREETGSFEAPSSRERLFNIRLVTVSAGIESGLIAHILNCFMGFNAVPSGYSLTSARAKKPSPSLSRALRPTGSSVRSFFW